MPFPSFSDEENVGGAMLFLNVPNENVELWWPNEYGNQTLYDFSAKFTASRPTSVASNDLETTEKSVRVAFR